MFEWLRNIFKRKGNTKNSVVWFGTLKKDEAFACNIDRVARHDVLAQSVATKNRRRQRDVLGYGLKSKYFKPRPAYEKRLWKLDKKPSDDLD